MPVTEKYPLPDWYTKWMVKPNYPTKWPNGARIAVLMHVPFEVWSERPLTAGTGRASLRARQTTSFGIPDDAIFKYDVMTMCEHDFGGRVGVWRILELLDKYEIKGTFPVHGGATVRYRDAVREIYRRGHEVISRGFYQEESSIYMTPEEEREDIRVTTEALLEVAKEVGAKREEQGPLGYIPSLGKWTSATDDIILDLGYMYLAAVHNDDRPYCIKYKGKPIVSVPLPDVAGAAQDGTINLRGYSPRDLVEVFKDEFDYWYEKGKDGTPGLVTMICHPYLGGRAYVVRNWQRMIEYAKGHPHVWFARRIDIAKWVLKNWPPA